MGHFWKEREEIQFPVELIMHHIRVNHRDKSENAGSTIYPAALLSNQWQEMDSDGVLDGRQHAVIQFWHNENEFIRLQSKTNWKGHAWNAAKCYSINWLDHILNSHLARILNHIKKDVSDENWEKIIWRFAAATTDSSRVRYYSSFLGRYILFRITVRLLEPIPAAHGPSQCATLNESSAPRRAPCELLGVRSLKGSRYLPLLWSHWGLSWKCSTFQTSPLKTELPLLMCLSNKLEDMTCAYWLADLTFKQKVYILTNSAWCSTEWEKAICNKRVLK